MKMTGYPSLTISGDHSFSSSSYMFAIKSTTENDKLQDFDFSPKNDRTVSYRNG